jgi:hypothetical protein
MNSLRLWRFIIHISGQNPRRDYLWSAQPRSGKPWRPEGASRKAAPEGPQKAPQAVLNVMLCMVVVEFHGV